MRRGSRSARNASPRWNERRSEAPIGGPSNWPAPLLIAAGVLVGVAVVGIGGGYWWGRHAAQAGIRETEAGLHAAFSRGPEAAKDWLALMIWNDPRKALAQCQGPAVSVQDGRRVCTVPLWVEPPPS